MSAQPDQRFPKHVRVRRQAEFDRVYESRLFAADEVLVVTAVQNGLSCTRLGLSVSRKVGNAVVRNRWKRLIREAFRRSRPQLAGGFDLVVRPRKGAVPDGAQIANSLPKLVRHVAQRSRRS